MSLERFTEILGKIPRTVRLLNLWHRGEPLACYDFPEMVALATARGIKTQTHTNGTLLAKKDFATRIVRAGLTRISIAVDSADEQTFSMVRKGGRLSDVADGIKAITEARAKAGARYPQIHIECLVANQTPEQLRAVKEVALGWGADQVKFKTYRVTSLTNLISANAILPADERFRRYKLEGDRLVTKRKHQGCARLAWSAVIAFNGDVLCCCFDANGEHVLGNILNQSWGEIWRGEKAKQFRKNVMPGNHGNKPSICSNCTEGLDRLYIPDRELF